MSQFDLYIYLIKSLLTCGIGNDNSLFVFQQIKKLWN